MLRGARIEAEWIKAPTAGRHRRAATASGCSRPCSRRSRSTRRIGRSAAAARRAQTPEEIAAALVRTAPRPHAGAPRNWPTAEAPRERPRPDGPRPGFEDTVWFRMDIGRRHNADPRWLLPLLCRRGHITKNEIGAIRIAANETLFEVPRAVAGKFAAALKRTAGGDWRRRRRRPDRSGRGQAARRRAGRTAAAGPPPVRHQAKPFRKGPKTAPRAGRLNRSLHGERLRNHAPQPRLNAHGLRRGQELRTR